MPRADVRRGPLQLFASVDEGNPDNDDDGQVSGEQESAKTSCAHQIQRQTNRGCTPGLYARKPVGNVPQHVHSATQEHNSLDELQIHVFGHLLGTALAGDDATCDCAEECGEETHCQNRSLPPTVAQRKSTTPL